MSYSVNKTAQLRPLFLQNLFTQAAVNVISKITRSVAAWFSRHGMPPPASNDKGTAFCFTN